MILDEIIKAKTKNLSSALAQIMPTQKGQIAQQIKIKKDLYVIGEIKKASPSKGVLVNDFNPIQIAQEYIEAGIDAISILTEEHFFKGKLQYLKDVRAITSRPLLRKDFIIDVREIIQAKQAGANLILLIVAILDDESLRSFYQVAYAIDLECIVEVHNEQELQRALAISPQIIGINNRDLMTFQVDLATTKQLALMIPEGIVVISESGIHTNKDIEELRKVGVDGVLIGECFMRCSNIATHVKSLLAHE